MPRYKKQKLHVDFQDEKSSIPVTILGVSFFLRMAYFFGFTRLETVGFWTLLVGLILPVIVEIGLIVLLRGLRFADVNVYLLSGVALCALLLLQGFQHESVLRIIVVTAAYLICAMSLLGLAGGYLTTTTTKWVLLGTAIGIFVFFNLFQNVFGLHWIVLIYEAAAIFDLIGLGLFAGNLKKGK